MEDFFVLLVGMLIGIAIGVSTLPWKHRFAPNESTFMYLLGWAAVWPFLLFWLLKDFFYFYRKSWWDYLAFLQYKKSTKSQRND